ncbi:hypothetical protein Desor_0026 [Desulfosporosinus orientis DSM 765]|uniref:Uncharacterized protein n=1 Tax=Desulfosporosinus orientis (strain ATCC 19365 / DSM 765 / NCIMB 8382 / VKM B-1628 / Singapore I) TaxID=768706 RepID=G7W7B3_DESOD|nr:CBO0543 family protein [Desulfosporosinus orientis]AET65784.1 hypothetical protein Desor_0026 [Desulfosporosinus orientis DSM 765]
MILVLVGVFITICFKWGEWRNWRLYYPTILFLIAGDFIAGFVASSKPLWKYEATIFSGNVTQLLVALIIYPCTILIFFHFIKKLKSVSLYILIWVSIYAFLEYFGVKYQYFSHSNGWNFGCSVMLDFILFSLLVIHQKNPVYAWIVSFITGLTITLIFKLPI